MSGGAAAPPERRVGLIAGSGLLPRLIADDLAARGDRYLVIGFEGAAPDWLRAHPHLVTPFEKPGALFGALRAAGLDAVAFAGGMRRPRLNPLRFDAKALALAGRVLPLLPQGDDALLRGLAAVFEAEGFRMIGAQELLGGLLAPRGPFSAARPSPADRADIAAARSFAALVGGADIGQGAVAAGGLCLGLETLQGTDAMLRFVAETPEALRPEGARGVLWKGPKRGQDRRADLPAIGPDTVRAAAAAGLAGIALRAGRAFVLDRAATVAAADEAGLFLLGDDDDDDEG